MKIETYRLDLPFHKKFVISHSTREVSESVIVKVSLDNGIYGYGECLPRKYVTGETQESVLKTLRDSLIPKVEKWKIKNYSDLINKLRKIEVNKNQNCALCALELALLDSYGKHFKKSVEQIFSGPYLDKIYYSGVISGGDGFFKKLLKIKLFGFKSVKIKVGMDNDLRNLKTARKILGNKVDIRVDANCAWGVSETLGKVGEFKKLNISAIEQPVKTIEEINKVAAKSKIPIIADESLCNLDDAKKLKNVIFDIRISKCGGLLKSLEIYNYAKKKGITCMLGCHVGESGILTAAGRHFALGVRDLKYLEGSYNHFLLKEDITKEDLTFGRKGAARRIEGYGLGIRVDKELIKRHIQ
ncbi:MAG: enolase C-terminal domain-like protein [Nanoarchaeota archaeon]